MLKLPMLVLKYEPSYFMTCWQQQDVFHRMLDLNSGVVLLLAVPCNCPETGLMTDKDLILPHNRSSATALW